ncbi:MAG TPA: hypothetical protein PLL10_01055 [Elusimicrobiales bacterium]|nr:hypothetical protein [Elusimicrobiales bacterium]
MRIATATILLLSAVECTASSLTLPAVDKQGAVGLLLLARPGAAQWEDACRDAEDDLESEGPVRLVLGPDDLRAVQKAVNELEPVSKKILAVPLGTAANSDGLQQFKYYAGISSVSFAPADSETGSYPGGTAPRLEFSLPLVLASSDEDSTALASLEKRLKPLMRLQSSFSLVLLGQESEGLREEALLPFLEKTAEALKRRLGFRETFVFVMKQPQPARMDKMMSDNTTGPVTKPANYQSLRDKIRSLVQRGKVLVAAYSPEDDDMQRQVDRELFGSLYTWAGDVSLSSAELVRSVKAARSVWGKYPSMRRYFNQEAGMSWARTRK